MKDKMERRLNIALLVEILIIALAFTIIISSIILSRLSCSLTGIII